VCALVGERLTGKGALAQLHVETGLPVWELEPAFLLLVALLATTAVIPFEGAWEGDSAPSAPALGVRFTADRQRRLGRLAMLSFAAALVAEAVTGQGPLDLLELDTGVPMDELEAGILFFTLILGFGDSGGDADATAVTAAAAPGAVEGPTFGDEESLPDEDEFDWNADDDDEDD
jgi:photosystem II protein